MAELAVSIARIGKRGNNDSRFNSRWQITSVRSGGDFLK